MIADNIAYSLLGSIADRLSCRHLPRPFDADDAPCSDSRLIEVVDCVRDGHDETGWIFQVSCSSCGRAGFVDGVSVFDQRDFIEDQAETAS